MSPAVTSRRCNERGTSLIEVLAALTIGTLLMSTIYLAIGTAVRSRLLVDSMIHNQQHGRLVVQWLGDRIRQAGYAVNTGSALPRCRDAIVVEDAAYTPTATRLYFNTDVAVDGTSETIGYQIGTEVVNGSPVNVVEERVTNCTVGASTQTSSVTDPTSIAILSLTFTYYNVSGAVVTDLVTPGSIRSIRMVRITLAERANAGAQGPRDQTWS
ncbi:MAG: PilW family protein, partial [bacterium]